MPDTDFTQDHAIQYAGKNAGEYLNEIGRTDLRELNKEEWKIFCEIMCINYAIKHAELSATTITLGEEHG